MIVVELPGQPQGKGRPRFGKGKVYTPAKTRSYEESLAWAAKAAMGARKLLDAHVGLQITASFEPPKKWPVMKQWRATSGGFFPTAKPDADNIMKAICDAFNGVVWTDDAQVVIATVVKRYADKAGIRVTVIEPGERMEPPDFAATARAAA